MMLRNVLVIVARCWSYVRRWGVLTWPGIAYTGSLASLEMLAWNMAGAGAFMGWHTVCGILTFGFLKVLY